MGLDMYLYAKRYVSNAEYLQQGDAFDIIASKVNATEFIKDHLFVEGQVAYWRKANAIHGWIINNSGAVDNCTPIHLTKQDLVQLRDDCQKVIDEGTKETAMELLPPTEGFFFGSNGIDEWYWEDIKDTIAKLNTALEQSVDDAMFEYQASW
jgi:hypothetical protein